MTGSAPLRLGMVGGGPGAFIGGVHRTAMSLDGLFVLVAGVFSSDPEKSRQQGRAWNIDPARVYRDYSEMVRGEAARPQADRIDAVVIVTPNHLHEPMATAFLGARVPVICDKPMAATLEQAERMLARAATTGVPLLVTYNYTGYPLVRHAREVVRSGQLGDVRKVVAHYHQGWLAGPIEQDGHKQASWRTDPARAGAGALGDIGSHVENLVSFVTGLEVESLRAEVSSIVESRRVDDDAAVTVRFKGGARGLYSISQVCIGRENDLHLEVFGSRGSLAWRQEDPNRLHLALQDGHPRIVTRGNVQGTAADATRLPPGHPEGFYEAFANIYRDAFRVIEGWKQGVLPATPPLIPTAADGLRGLHFIDACLRSAKDNGAWVTLP